MIEFMMGRIDSDLALQARVQQRVDKAKTVLVIEDASHEYAHTLNNMDVLRRWVTPGSYMLVQDTKLDRFATNSMFYPSIVGPMRAVDTFMAAHGDEFVIDRRFEYLMYSQHHRGFLRRKPPGG
jgi:cephalosporin hydroxylase